MANNDVGVNVVVNFQGVTYNSSTQTWSGSPSLNTSPNPAKVPPSKSGDTNTLVWTLRAAAVPANFNAAFPATGAIAFSGTNAWTGGTPTLQGDGTYQCQDNFDDLENALDYYYSVTVMLTGTGPNAGVSQSFTMDPDVENEAGSATLTHTPS